MLTFLEVAKSLELAKNIKEFLQASRNLAVKTPA